MNEKIISEQVDNVIKRVVRKYIKEDTQSNDYGIIFDKMTWHFKEDPKKVVDAFLKTFKDLKEKDYLTGSGEAILQKLESIASKENIDEADVASAVDITLSSDDVNPIGLHYAKDKLKYGIKV